VSSSLSINERLVQIEGFDFRTVHPNVLYGTASDRYAGWIGQIYDESWSGVTRKRRKKLGGQSFQEVIVPLEAVSEYFEHFSVLELDFTFYRPLVEADGSPSTNYGLIERYAEYAPENAKFLVKAPQMFTAPFIRGMGANEQYLDAPAYTRQFQDPLVDMLGQRLHGIIFEQGYQPIKKSPPAEQTIESLDAFFEHIGKGPQVHLELRSTHLLTPLYFDWLETRGLGFVYSHWTWLPSIKSQWKRSGRFTAANKTAVLRLLTPRKMPYADAYAVAHPFDRVVPELSNAPGASTMIDEAVALCFKAMENETTIDLITNNRAWGNAPELAKEIARRLLEFERRRQ